MHNPWIRNRKDSANLLRPTRRSVVQAGFAPGALYALDRTGDASVELHPAAMPGVD